MKPWSLVVAGVGGQGVITTARLVGLGAIEAGLEARVGQIYGLSQRGGSVQATVRIGPVGTALVPSAGADVVLGLEPLEAERTLASMSPATAVVVNSTPIVPTSLTLQRADYPELETIIDQIAAVAGSVRIVDGTARAEGLGNPRLANVVMLGALDGLELLPVPTEAMESAIRQGAGARDPELLISAYRAGRELAAETSLSRMAE
ncbi:MAG: 2-oxoacid:acceptor oxidoreductase family protein [Acidimicrobiia bacterium]